MTTKRSTEASWVSTLCFGVVFLGAGVFVVATGHALSGSGLIVAGLFAIVLAVSIRRRSRGRRSGDTMR